MKSILEIQEEIERNVPSNYSVSIDDYTPSLGGVLNIDREGECVYSESIDTLPQALEAILVFFRGVKDGSISPEPIDKTRRLRPRKFVLVFCSTIEMTLETLCKRTRRTQIRQPRQLVTSLMHLNLWPKYSLSEIGSAVDQDHATVLHSVKVVSDMFETDPKYRNYYAEAVKQFSKALGFKIKHYTYEPATNS